MDNRDERWSTLAAEYKNDCARLRLVKPEIESLFARTLPPSVPRLDLRPPDEHARMMEELHMDELHGLEQNARRLMDTYAAAQARRQLWVGPVKRTGAKL